MPVDWSDNLPDTMRRSCLSNNEQSVPEMEHIPNLVPSENFYHTIKGVSKPDEQLKVLFYPNSFSKNLLSTVPGFKTLMQPIEVFA